MDDLNLGRTQPPAAFQMGVMWAVLCRTGGFDLKWGTNVFEEISVCSFTARICVALQTNLLVWGFCRVALFSASPICSTLLWKGCWCWSRFHTRQNALQHKEVSKVWLSGLSSKYLVLALRLCSGAQFPEAFANLSRCFGCPAQALRTRSLRVLLSRDGRLQPRLWAGSCTGQCWTHKWGIKL